MARREPRSRDTKVRILSAALEQFARRGYAQVSVEDIARQAGVTAGAFYYYFRNKRDLVADLQQDLWTRFQASAAAAYDPGADALTNIKSTLHAFFAPLRSVEEARFFLREVWLIRDLDDSTRRILEEWVGQTAQLLRRAMDTGDIVRRDPEALAQVLIGAFSEATIFLLTSHRVKQTNEVLDRLVDAFRVTNSGEPPEGRPSTNLESC